MTKFEKLNTASDLRRIALWIGTKQDNKNHLIDRFWNGAIKKPFVMDLMKKYNIGTKVSAEDALFLSLRLQQI